MILDQYYISTNENRALEDLNLAIDELESIVGRFTRRSSRFPSLRGQVIIKHDSIEIHKCFGKGKLFSKKY